MKDLIQRLQSKKRPLRWMALGLACILAAGVIVPVVRATRAVPLGYPVMGNHPFAPPSPPPPVFGPDMTAWSLYQDHPGYDRAFTAQKSREYTGVTSPNHIYIGSNTLVFQGYDEDANLDYIFSEEFQGDAPALADGFKNIAFSLRPIDLKFHALSQSGFLFNGSIDGGLYTGYMISLEAREVMDALGIGTGERVADLRLYSVADADLHDPDAFMDLAARTLVSTYAIGISEASKWPVYIRVEQDAAGSYQVYIDGQLRTRDLPPVTDSGSNVKHGFGFFTGYARHLCNGSTCNELTSVAYANIRIEADWRSVNTTATVRFKDASDGSELADPQILGGQTGQTYYIKPPSFPGYSMIEATQKCLNPIHYFAVSSHNETTLYYVKKTVSYKEATYRGVQNNGTAENPVPVEAGEVIDYKIHAGGDGQNNWYGSWVNTIVNQGPISMGDFEGINNGGRTWKEMNPGVSSPNNGNDVEIGLQSTSRSGNITVTSNTPLVSGFLSTNQGGTLNDGVIIGFKPPSGKLYVQGNPGLAAMPYITPPPDAHTINDNFNAANLANNRPLIRNCGGVCNGGPCSICERYITITFNKLRNDASYLMDFMMGMWNNAQPWDYIVTIKGKDFNGNPVTIEINRGNYTPSINGWTGQITNITQPAIPWPSDYVDPVNGLPYVFPDGGKIDVTFTRIHNTRHDHNILIGSGEMQRRSRQTVLRIVDLLPLGTTYVPGSSGQHEGNLIINTLPNGQQELIWEFGAVPAEGYDIEFQAKITAPGLFINNAFIDYSLPCPLPDVYTNNTYHMTGMAALTEHFLDYNNHSVTLKPDRTIDMPLGENYTTSVVSQSEIMHGSDTYQYIGYRIVPDGQSVGSGPVIEEPPPNPTIPNITTHREIELFFFVNPTVTIEYRRLTDDAALRAPETVPVTFGDPYFLPDSVRDPIDFPAGSGNIYNYVAYAMTDGGIMQPIVHGLPDKPVYRSVKENQTIVVYFLMQHAVTVHYVEYGNPSNALRNSDYYPVNPAPDNDFPVAPVAPAAVSAGGKSYMYEGYSLPGGPFVPGMPPTSTVFTNINGNKVITLYYSTTYLITVKWHEDLPYYAGKVYEELMPPQTFTFRANERDPNTGLPLSFNMTAVTQIAYGGALYSHTGQFKWTSDAEQARPDPPVNPVTVHLNEVNGDYTIIFLYTKQSTQQMHNVMVLFREFGNTANVLAADRNFVKAPGSSFHLVSELQSLAPPIDYPNIDADWTYYGYTIDDSKTVIPGPPPLNPTLGDIQQNHVITLQYVPRGTVLERFRALNNINEILAPDQTVILDTYGPDAGKYNPKAWIPPQRIYVDEGHDWLYQGYQINGGPVHDVPYENIPRPMSGVPGIPDVVMFDTITYLYINTALYIVTEEFRIWEDPWADPDPVLLANDKKVEVVPMEDFEPGVTPGSTIPLPTLVKNGRVYYYAGYALSTGEKDGSIIRSAKIAGSAPQVPYSQVGRNGYIITYLYRTLDLHVRQVILVDGTETDVEWPLMGYLNVMHGSDVMPATCTSGRDDTNVKYTDYAIPFDIDDFNYLVRLTVPQNYTFEGHNLTHTNAAHDPALRTLPDGPSGIANGAISIDFEDSGEWWLTLYIKPAEPTGDHHSSYATNIFGSMVQALTSGP
ncbi:MAG: MucBP domain-containing protein [Oscillospiraceae bacterium]|nr:MucBP domain-containing protein [Oscillospiraceae bacterium]